MNKKIIIGAGAVLGLVVIVIGVYLVRLQSEAAKWKSAKEIVEEEISRDGIVTKARFVSIVDAPLNKVQDALWRVEEGSKRIDNIKQSELVSAQGNKKVVKMAIQALTLPLQHYTMEFTLDPGTHTLTFKSVESQVQEIEGSYKLEPSPDGKQTRITYESLARDKVAVPAPQSVIEGATRETFVKTVRGIEKAATEG
jgi:hypothetical protein